MLRIPFFLALFLTLAPVGFGQLSSQVYGLNFGPFLNGQAPGTGLQISSAQITARMQIISPYTKWVRSFGSTNGLENIPAVARQLGLKVAATAFISRDLTQNGVEIANLIAAANAGRVDIAIVGSEVLRRGDVSESQLIAYMNQVRQAIPSLVPVTTAEIYGILLASPNLIAASDVVFANFYPYWEGVAVQNAVCTLAQQYQRMVIAAGSKQVVISETGWPSGGDAVGAAIPTTANSSQYFRQFTAWAGTAVPYFYFEAFDEAWKATVEGPQGAFWGLWDASGLIKPGIQAVFGSQSTPPACDAVIDGAGAPGISLTYVPPYGSADALQGRATHVSPASFGVAVYINVGGGWWTKPTFNQPVTPLQTDGTWTAPIVTGGSDSLASGIAAFLIPSSFSPPLLSGAASLPTSLSTIAVAQTQFQRSQGSISGTVKNALNHPLPGVTVTAAGLGSATSAPDGRYSFSNLPPSGTAILVPSFPNVVFTPTQAVLNISGTNQQANFIGSDVSSCAFALTPPAASFSSAAAGGSVTVSAPDGCVWSTAVNDSWISITSGGSGIGSGTVTYAVAANSGAQRTGTVQIAGQTFTVTQAGTGAGIGLRFVPLTPCRIMDTRIGSGLFGAPAMAAGATRTIPIPASPCRAPSNARAYALNVTVVPPGPLSFLTAWPTGQAKPLVSTLNSFEGKIVANNAIVPAGTGGAIDLYVTDATDVIVDINGYFTDDPIVSNLVFYSVAPCRLADTRSGQGTTGSFGPPALTAGSTRSLPVPGGRCGIPPRAQAYSLNFTVVPPAPLSFLTAWPTGQSRPLVSTLNSFEGRVVANGAIIPAGANGSIDVFVTDATDLVVDVNGYFAPDDGTGQFLFPLTPCRVADTRTGQGTSGQFGPPSIAAGSTRTVPIPSGRCGVPGTAQGYSLNATVVPSGPLGYLTAWPVGVAQPLVSLLNSFDGRIVANGAIVPGGIGGAINIFATNTTDVILDLNGYFGR